MKKSVFIAFSALLVACTTDLYEDKTDPTVPEEGNTVPDGPSFSTITKTTLNVTVDDQFNGVFTYGVEVYAENPLLTKGIEPMFAGITKGNKPLVMTVVIPDALQEVYVLQKDPTKGESVIKVAVSAGTTSLSCDFRAQNITSKSALRSATPTKAGDTYDLSDDIYSLDKYELKQTNVTYVIPADKEMTYTELTVGEGVVLVVNGTLNTNRLIAKEGSKIENNCKILVSDKFESKEGANISLGKSTIFKCKSIESVKSTYTMDSYSILRTTESATFSTESVLKAVGTDFCLADLTQMDLVSGENEIALFASKNIQMICSTTTHVKGLFDEGITYVDKQGSIHIDAVGCSGEGNVVDKDKPSDVEQDKNNMPNGGLYTFAMEDNWPSLGDYDMNDLVLGLTSTLKVNGNDEVTEMDLTVRLRAVGGTKKIGAGIQFNKIPSSNISLARAGGDLDGSYFNPASNGVEEGDKAVFPFFDDAHHLLGGASARGTMNTVKQEYAVKEILCNIKFIRPVLKSDLLISELNFFIVNGGNAKERTEVHLAGFEATSKVKGKASYWSSDGMTWGILIPGEFKYPKEYIRITEAYKRFAKWSQSGCREEKDWYKDFVSGKVMEEKEL